MKKKGFTLIEIIMCISLISIISVCTTVIVIKNNENKEQKALNNYKTLFDNALKVYLSNHKEITNNLNNNVKAAAVTLEVLKNDGLIVDDLDIDYKNNYYLLSNAKLLDNDAGNKNCENDVIAIEVFAKWDLSGIDGSKVIYVCPKNSSSNSLLQERYTGYNPNNYIKLNETLWRIVEATDAGIYVISTDKNDLINHSDYSTANINFTEKYYNIYLEKDSTFLYEINADNGHLGLDTGAFNKYMANIGTLNYTTIMNATNASGNYLIELLTSMDSKIAFGSFTWQDNQFYLRHSVEWSEYKIVPVIKLKECLNIDGGTGTSTDPFILSNNMC